MKDLKQRVAQQVNKLEGVGGRFWDGAFKCKLIGDEQQLVATSSSWWRRWSTWT